MKKIKLFNFNNLYLLNVRNVYIIKKKKLKNKNLVSMKILGSTQTIRGEGSNGEVIIAKVAGAVVCLEGGEEGRE